MLLGHMVQGDWIEPGGNLAMEVSVYFDILRLWDSRAVWWKMETDDGALFDNILFAESRKAQVMFTFGEPPASAILSGQKVPTQVSWQAFISRVIAEGRGRIGVYEGWNEPANPQYWDGTPELLVEYEQSRYELTRKLAPGTTILSPSFTEVELPHGQAFLKRYIAAGGLDWCDAVAWHGYAAKPVDLVGQITALRQVIGSKPIWNTEHVIGTGLGSMRDGLILQASLDVKCAVWNAEIPGSEDYTDATMQQVHNELVKPKRGCLAGLL